MTQPHTGAERADTAPATAARGDARIHNIGYRHYDGPRLGRSYARRSLFTHSLRGAYGLGRAGRSKVLPMGLFAVMCLPAVVIVAVAVTVGMDEFPLEYPRYVLFLQPILGLYLALAAPAMVSLDLRYRTTPLYFSRPIERSDYALAKFGAMSAALLTFACAPLVLLYAGGLLAELGFVDQTTAFLQGLLGAVLFCLPHAALALLIASFTPRRGFGVAAIIAVQTIPYFAVLAVQAVAWEQGTTEAVGWLGLFSTTSLYDGLQGKYLGGDVTDFPGRELPPDAAGPVYLLVLVGLTLLCHLLLVRRYRKAGL